MPLENNLTRVLEYYTKHTPPTEDAWYAPWSAMLSFIFRSAEGYSVTHRSPIDPDCHISDFILEVIKVSTAPFILRTVLIVKIKNSQHWESGIPTLERQLNRQLDAAFIGTAHTKLYWIGAIGPHWRYGEKEEDRRDAQPLIGWHHTTHDQASLDDLQVLARLVAAL